MLDTIRDGQDPAPTEGRAKSHGLETARSNGTLSKASSAEGQGPPAHSFTHPHHSPSVISEPNLGRAVGASERNKS